MSTNGDGAEGDEGDDPVDELPAELAAEVEYTRRSLRELAAEHGVDVDAIDAETSGPR